MSRLNRFMSIITAGLNKKYVTGQLTAAAAASATAQETLAGIRTVKSFAKEQHIIERYDTAASHILSWGLKSAVAGKYWVDIFRAVLSFGFFAYIWIICWWECSCVVFCHVLCCCATSQGQRYTLAGFSHLPTHTQQMSC